MKIYNFGDLNNTLDYHSNLQTKSRSIITRYSEANALRTQNQIHDGNSSNKNKNNNNNSNKNNKKK